MARLKWPAVVVGVMLVVGAGFEAHKEWRAAKSAEAVKRQIAVVVSHADNYARALLGDAATFGEAFRKADAFIEQADAAAVALKLDQAVSAEDRQPAEAYVEALQDMARHTSAVLTARQEVARRLELARQAMDEIAKAQTAAGVRYALDRSSQYVDGMKVEQQALDAARLALAAKVKQVELAEQAMRRRLPGAMAVESEQIQAIFERHAKPAEKATSAPAVKR